MATTTPNYGWTVPTSTDLVKDGATAIETLGDSVDATVKALNPETTLGDISYRSSTANTKTRLGIGTTGQVLSVSGGVPAWSTPSSGALALVKARTSFSNVANTGTNFDNVFTNTYNNYVIVIDNYTAVTAGATIAFNFRSGGATNATANYYSGYNNVTWNGTTAPVGNAGGTYISLGTTAGAGNVANLVINYFSPRAATTDHKLAFTGYSPQLQGNVFGAGFINVATNWDGFILSNSSTNIYTANVTIYGLVNS